MLAAAVASASAAAAAAAALNGFPLSNAKISEKRKLIEEIALADVKKVRQRQKTFFSVCQLLPFYLIVN